MEEALNLSSDGLLVDDIYSLEQQNKCHGICQEGQKMPKISMSLYLGGF